MPDIFLVRHGQSEYNAGLTDAFNSNLTPKGVKQAEKVALSLNKLLSGDYVGYVSPYNRCLQTAYNIYYTLNKIKFIVSASIGESPEDIHRNKNCRVDNLRHGYPAFDWSKYPEKYDYTCESFIHYKQRLISFIGKLKSNSLIISHVTPIKDIIREICFEGKPEQLTIPNCSISLIRDGKPIMIGELND